MSFGLVKDNTRSNMKKLLKYSCFLQLLICVGLNCLHILCSKHSATDRTQKCLKDFQMSSFRPYSKIYKHLNECHSSYYFFVLYNLVMLISNEFIIVTFSELVFSGVSALISNIINVESDNLINKSSLVFSIIFKV